MVATAAAQMEVLVKAPLPVNLEKPTETCMPVEVVDITQMQLVLVVLVEAALPVTLAKQTLAAEAVLAVQAAPVSSSSASIRRRQHEIRNRN